MRSPLDWVKQAPPQREQVQSAMHVQVAYGHVDAFDLHSDRQPLSLMQPIAL